MKYFEHTYLNTYYYSNIVSNILQRDIELIGFISNFFANEETIFNLAKPFQKYSAFHCFIHYMIADFFENDMDEYDQRIFEYHKVNKYAIEPLYAESALKEYELYDYSFKEFINSKNEIEYSDIEAYRDDLILSGRLEELYDKITNEVFYVMFNNREALLQFNYIFSEQLEMGIGEIEGNEVKALFTRKGFLKRTKIPEWCKKAVFFRDRGRCCLCTKDLSGIISIKSEKQYDHIIPLAKGGLNDVSNIQLLCSNCNNKKNKLTIETSNYYESWY